MVMVIPSRKGSVLEAGRVGGTCVGDSKEGRNCIRWRERERCESVLCLPLDAVIHPIGEGQRMRRSRRCKLTPGLSCARYVLKDSSRLRSVLGHNIRRSKPTHCRSKSPVKIAATSLI